MHFKVRTIVIYLLLASAGSAQVKADLRPCVFFSPGSGPFLETNLTVDGNSVGKVAVDGKWRNSVHVTTRIFRDKELVKSEAYNLHGPFYSDSTQSPTFIDCQRYALPNGKYQLEMVLRDFNSGARPLTIKSEINIAHGRKVMACSAIQPVEKFSKAAATGPLTKSGYDLVPYNTDFYPVGANLSFYWEVYNADTNVGKGRPVVLEWYLETAGDSSRLSSYGGYRKQHASPVNVLLASADISKLGTGHYAVVAMLKDADNKVKAKEKYYFTRHNEQVSIASLQMMSEAERVQAFAGTTESADTLQMFVESLWPIADNVDKERIVNESVKKDKESMRLYLADFWQRRAADTGNALNLWAAYYRQVQQVMALFKCGKQKGYYTDRGRVYLQYGAPNSRTEQRNEPNTFPYEIWHYYRIVDGSTGHFFSNRKFVFVNRNLGDECHSLVHSDMRGEINNPRWQYEVTRRNYDGISNPDQNAPRGIENNQFQEIYQNPR